MARFTDRQVYAMLEAMHVRGWNDRHNDVDGTKGCDAYLQTVQHIHELFTMAEEGKFDNTDAS